MSGLILVHRRDGGPGDDGAFAAMLGELSHLGPDGRGVASGPGWALGVQRFVTTPEDVGDTQPLRHPEAGLTLAFDGRLDNREDLISALGLPGGARHSDAAIVLAAFERWREGCFARLVGPFAAVVVDERARRVVCARDPLGDRTLVYAERPGALLVASEERALLAHPGVDDALDETSVARFLGVMPPAEGATFFAGIRELPRAHLLVSDSRGLRTERYWDLDLTPLRYRRDWEYVDHFREVLAEAVRCRLRATSRAGVLMSGGLDSTTVAALAATGEGPHGSPLVLSWVFDELPGTDERAFMAPVVEHHGLEWVQIRGDDAWPLCPDTGWCDDPSSPGEAPSRALWDETARTMGERGCRVLLTGEHGDHLYFGSEYWLASLLEERRPVAALGGLVTQAVAGALGRRPRGASLRSSVSTWLRAEDRATASLPVRPWLNVRAAELVASSLAGPQCGRREAARRRCVEDLWASWGLVLGHRAGLRQGIDVRRPYRDRRLVELTARLPEHCFFRNGWRKWIVRRAAWGLLPDRVRWRRWGSSHLPRVARGLAERGWERAERLLRAGDATWSDHVLPERLWRGFPSLLAGGRDGAETALAWQCLCLEEWLTRRARGSGRVPAAAAC